MTVSCANCGEELLGAVNRCWRCGQHVVSAPGADEAPPIRSAPSEMQPVVVASIVSADEGAAASTLAPSEFSAPSFTQPQPPRPAVYTQRGMVDVAAVGSMVMGAFSLLLGLFFAWALVPGLFGIAAGIAGLKSRWRQLAILGLLLSLIGLAGSSARLALDIATSWYGQSLLGPTAAPSEDTQLPESLE